jgi:hypothetical protein
LPNLFGIGNAEDAENAEIEFSDAATMAVGRQTTEATTDFTDDTDGLKY